MSNYGSNGWTVVMTIFPKGGEEIEVLMKSDESASSLTSYYT